MDMLSFTLMIADAALKAQCTVPWVSSYEWELAAIEGANAYYVDLTPCYPIFYGKYQPDGQPWDWGNSTDAILVQWSPL